MEKQLFENATPENRKQYLHDAASKVEQENYLLLLDSSQRTEHQERLSKLQADILQAAEEKREAMRDFNESLKHLKEQNVELVKTLKQNAKEVLGTVYHITDDENVGIYNEYGTLLRSRPLMESEKQKTIFELKQASND